MLKLERKEQCAGCYACAVACPAGCITMQQDREGFRYPAIDTQRCISCGLCQKVCPVLGEHPANEILEAYAAINRDEAIRQESSSGGVFTLLAQSVLDRGGVVFGAAFSEDFRSVEHIAVTTAEQLGKLRGSKYVQSRIGTAYEQAQELLKQDTPVLFTGTPCQIAGLYAYLRKPYPSLITQDLICHGVPSPLVWEKYVESREQCAGGKTAGAAFRNKERGWRQYALKMDFDNRAHYSAATKQDLYLRAFVENSTLRPSCYSCAFKGTARVSDITLADFWGIEKVLPEMDDDRGISLVLLNTAKGQECFQKLLPQLRCCPTAVQQAIAYNPSATQSSKLRRQRKAAMKAIDRLPVGQMLERYSKPPLSRRIKSSIKKLLRRA